MREVQLPAVLGSGWELINVGLLHSLNVYCLCLVLCLGVLVLRARKGISSLCSNHTQKEIFKNIFWWDIMRKVVLNSPIAQLKVLDLGFGSSSAGHQSVHARARTPHCVPLRAQNPSRKSQITAVSQSLPLVIWNVWGNLISCGSLSQMRNGNWFKKKKKATAGAVPGVPRMPHPSAQPTVLLFSHGLGPGFWLPEVAMAWPCY